MFEMLIRPVPCGSIIGKDPNGPLAFGSLGFTDATSKLVGGGVCD
jgi:hypothetical protein